MGVRGNLGGRHEGLLRAVGGEECLNNVQFEGLEGGIPGTAFDLDHFSVDMYISSSPGVMGGERYHETDQGWW